MELVSKIHSNLFLSAIFIANVCLWTYLAATFFPKVLEIMLNKKNLIKQSGFSFIPFSLKYDVNPIRDCMKAPKSELRSALMLEFTESFNETFEQVNDDISHIYFQLESDFTESIVPENILSEQELNQISMIEISTDLDMKIVRPLQGSNSAWIQQLDEINMNLVGNKSTLIITNLVSPEAKEQQRGLKIETFYPGVDVITNFKRDIFYSRREVLRLLDGVRKKYDQTILLAAAEDKWSFGTTMEGQIVEVERVISPADLQAS